MPEAVPHGHYADLSMDHGVDIRIMNGDGRGQPQLVEQPEPQFIGCEEKGHDGKGSRHDERHDDANGDIGATPETEEQDAQNMAKKGQAADKSADRCGTGDVMAMGVPEYRAGQVMGKAPQRSFAEDVLAGGKATECR